MEDTVDTFAGQMVSSGVPALDALLGDGVHRGTSMLLVGPAGAGKSSLATQYALAALERGRVRRHLHLR